MAAGLLLGGSFANAAQPRSDDSGSIRIIPNRRIAPPPAPVEPAVTPGAPGIDAVPPAPGPGTPTGTPTPNRPAGQPQSQAPAPADSGGPRIVPAAPGLLPSGRATYYDIYRTIPFSRAEYESNPSYRSELATGLLFNQMPQVSIVKNASPPNVAQYGYITPYKYSRSNGNSMNYNFFYPRPSVYRNY